MYIRLVVGNDGDNHRRLTGLITEARILYDNGDLSPEEELELDDHFGWLNYYLPVPPYKTSNWSKNSAAWFKDSAKESINHLWAIGEILKNHGFQIKKLKSKNPGKILYEDDYQIVVDEWKQL